MLNECPLCEGEPASIRFEHTTGTLHVECQTCGTFGISREAIADRGKELTHHELRKRLTRYIHAQCDSGKPAMLCNNLIDEIKSFTLPSGSAMGDELLALMVRRFPDVGSEVTLDRLQTAARLGVDGREGLAPIVDYLKRGDLFLETPSSDGVLRGHVTVKGYERAGEQPKRP